MEPESHASLGDAKARLSRAQNSAASSAMQITNALGSIIASTGTPTPANQPLWRRVDVFSRTDLDGILRAEAQSDIADCLRVLVSLHTRLTDARWEISSAAGEGDSDVLIGHGSGITTMTTTTTVDALELLAEVLAAVAGALESLDTRLTAQTVFDTPIPISVPAYVREIQASTARVSTQPDAVWTWESHLDAN
ncbi:MAG: hypothetical protein P0Y60_00095 [Candidatus Microbacterium colombiense]|nr:MAG: hypothetical protein P0Y60_00095 [Microbacterium sp.]